MCDATRGRRARSVQGAALAALCLLSAAGLQAAPAMTWTEKFYDPAPSSQEPIPDLVLPLPCGGGMVLRPIEIPASDWLDDHPVELGQSDAERGYKEGRRLGYLAGSFSVPGKQGRFYYLGKYEVTRDQYAAVMASECPKASMRGRIPVTSVSWFEAVEYASRLTEWLLANAREVMPHEDKEYGFLRLPTEEEWEFAARGGLAVDAADFLATRFPMPDGDLAGYAWYESSGSADGQLHPMGLLKPNPLGLHDILGNAAELTFSPFHLDHHGRMHGQSGGFVSRGGDIFTPEAQLGSAWRQENNYFDSSTGKAKALDSLGFRLALTAPVIVSPERLNEIKASWSELPARTGDPSGDAMQALAQLETLSMQTRDQALRTRLEIIQRDMERSQTIIGEARQRTLRALLRAGAFMGKRVVTDNKKTEAITQLMDMGQASFERFKQGLAGRAGAQTTIDDAAKVLASKKSKWQDELDHTRQDADNSLSYYSDAVIGVSQDYTGPETDAALAVVEEELRLKRNEYLIPYAKRFVDHLADYRGKKVADKRRWLGDLVSSEGRYR